MDVEQSFPRFETFADEGVEVLLEAQALEMGGEVTHPSVGEMASIAKGSSLDWVPLVGAISLAHGGLDDNAERVSKHVGRISARAEIKVDGSSREGNTPVTDSVGRLIMALRGQE